MEIYRTDGGGKIFVDERLNRVMQNIDKVVVDDFFECIDTVRDHKGTLLVSINENYKSQSLSLDYIYGVFLTFWTAENEQYVSIFFNDVCVAGYEFNYNKEKIKNDDKNKKYLFSLLAENKDINPTELSRVFKVSRQTIYNWANDFNIKS